VRADADLFPGLIFFFTKIFWYQVEASPGTEGSLRHRVKHLMTKLMTLVSALEYRF
jgi:hypothetical protein